MLTILMPRAQNINIDNLMWPTKYKHQHSKNTNINSPQIVDKHQHQGRY